MAIITSILTGGSNNHETTSEEANAVYTDFVSEGIVGSVTNTSGVAPATGGFAVNASGTPDTNVQVSAGVAYVTGTPTSQNSQTFRIKNTATASLAISSNASGSTKYDWIYISLDATNLNTPNTAGDDVATIVASRSSSAASDDGTPPTYGYPIAVVTVANGFSTITNSNIRDIRAQVALNTGSSNASDGWVSLSGVTSLSTVSGYNHGNREYELTASTDLTAVLSPGMRLKVTRATSPPTQCADLEASSSQYASKTSPAGLTFTDDFTCEAWIKPESYTLGGIVARRNGSTEGWCFRINADGAIALIGLRIASNNKSVTTDQAVPLGQWTHVAATFDMSASTGTTYFDGVSVPNTISTTGTASALVQGTTALVVGAEQSAGTNTFDGKIADVRVWSAIRTATQIKDNMNQQLVGDETNLVAYFKLNGDLNDSTSNANNLTGQAGAVATNADNPMNSTEYAIVTKVSSTLVTVFTGIQYNIPNATLSNIYYSHAKTPFGFSASKDIWTVSSVLVTNRARTNTAYGSLTDYLVVPIGAWELSIQGVVEILTDASTSTRFAFVTLSSDASTETNPDTTIVAVSKAEGTSTQGGGATARAVDYINLSSQTTYTLLGKAISAGTLNLFSSTAQPTLVRAVSAFL